MPGFLGTARAADASRDVQRETGHRVHVARLPVRTGRDTIAGAEDRIGINDCHRVFSVSSRARFRARTRNRCPSRAISFPAANIEDVIAVQNAARL
ncbi:hypothetical protein [Burkholderia sp. Bp8998]|uniref:hypothetical protein n=1 Tax=Burkholderia sp. Bp8998 TaxID=2184557 RepID=UPI003908BA22